MDIMNTAEFQTHLTAIMETLAKTAVVEISKLLEENASFLRLEFTRFTSENESLKKKCHFLENELQSARKSAGKMNGSPAPFNHPGLTGSAVTSDERCVAQSSEDFITYTVPSDDQVQLNVHQTPAEEQALDGATHGHITAGSVLSPDVGFIPNNLNFNGTVTPKKKFKCVFCGKTFEYLSHMTRHMRKHSGEKPYVCTVCGKRFAQKTYLITHERTHSGERPYACMECGKSFSQKSSLNVHLRSHTGEKPYSCSHCGKSYAFKIALRTHRC
ncbi:zinc finger protein 37-like [Sinocyclocheilus grahami]|uniref:zinc finger protein 37-like n=1 Tax=Sinocyclocheilus grahami TaxID=75366 RepID=UPI0007ACEE90|nr:PREDICTED: zinc finger protein 37-like [Sinocyclocheilus grahami]